MNGFILVQQVVHRYQSLHCELVHCDTACCLRCHCLHCNLVHCGTACGPYVSLFTVILFTVVLQVVPRCHSSLWPRLLWYCRWSLGVTLFALSSLIAVMQVASVCGGMYSNWTDGMCTLRTHLSDLCGHMLVLYVSLHAHCCIKVQTPKIHLCNRGVFGRHHMSSHGNSLSEWYHLACESYINANWCVKPFCNIKTVM